VGRRILCKCSRPRRDCLEPNPPQVDSNARWKQFRGYCATVRSVTAYIFPPGEYLHVQLSVEELAKKKDVKMAQIAVAWSLKRATTPIVGATKLQNLKETIGELGVTHGSYLGVLIRSAEALDIELTEEEIKYLEEPYLPNAIWGHS